jgi:hypothetical protein
MTRGASTIAFVCVVSAVSVANLANLAAADEVHLDNGEVIEGKAERHGDKVTIELESGRITLSAANVKQIVKRESSVERADVMARALRPTDVAGRMRLAEYCREHGMRDRERRVLVEVIAIEPNHEAARVRLGHVRTPTGWQTYAEHMRSQGKVERFGQWVSREQAEQQDREQAQARAEARQRELAQTELESKKTELDKQRVELERERLELENARAGRTTATMQPAIVNYAGGYRYDMRSGGDTRGARPHHRRHNEPATSTFPISGVRDPRDESWTLPGVRHPREGMR